MNWSQSGHPAQPTPSEAPLGCLHLSSTYPCTRGPPPPRPAHRPSSGGQLARLESPACRPCFITLAQAAAAAAAVAGGTLSALPTALPCLGCLLLHTSQDLPPGPGAQSACEFRHPLLHSQSSSLRSASSTSSRFWEELCCASASPSGLQVNRLISFGCVPPRLLPSEVR